MFWNGVKTFRHEVKGDSAMKFDKNSAYSEVDILRLLVEGRFQAYEQAVEPVLSLAKKEKPALLESLKEPVSIETGSRDLEGLDKLANIIAGRLKNLTDRVELV